MGNDIYYNNPINDAEYQDFYREALMMLEQKVGSAPEPLSNNDGHRRCRMLGFTFDDFGLFSLVWGDRVAEQIRRERSAFLKSTSA